MQVSTRYCIHPLATALLAGLGLDAVASGALAATRIAVTTTGDAGTSATCTLRQAIVAMNNAGSTTGTACVASTLSGSTDTIVFDTATFPSNGANVITLADAASNQLSITDADLTIDASANGNVTVQRSATAANAFGILYDATYGALTIDSLTITNGKLTAPQPSHYAFGAGISCVCSNLTLSNSTVTGNSIAAAAYSAGGGIFVYSGDLVLTNSTVSNNSVSGNSGASGMGGGIFVRPNVYTHVGGNATIADSQITGNSAGGNGGGLHVGRTLSMTNSMVGGNAANNNGGGMKVYGVTTLTGSTVSGNTASNNGGGVYDASGFYGVASALITFNYSTLSDNRVTNSSGSRGGGLFTRVGNLSFSNSTISGNSAANGYGYGGGIYVRQNDGPITMQHTTLAGNTASKRGGGMMIMTGGAGAVTFNGTLFSNTLAPSTGGGNIGVTYGGINISGSNNLVYPGVSITGDTINATFANAPLTGDPKLTALGKFGGTTKTRAPLPGSAAIDAFAPVAAACPVARDQRYVQRPQGTGCDIGAVEYRATDGNDIIFVDGFDP